MPYRIRLDEVYVFRRVGQIPQKFINFVEPAIGHADMIEIIDPLHMMFDFRAPFLAPQRAEIGLINTAIAERRFTQMRAARIYLAIRHNLGEERQGEA